MPENASSEKTALITGITGQDGSYLAELLLTKGYKVYGVVRRASTENFERIAHLHATTPTYESQPQVVPSPDGKRVIFASNWDVSTGPIQAYVADVRSPALQSRYEAPRPRPHSLRRRVNSSQGS